MSINDKVSEISDKDYQDYLNSEEANSEFFNTIKEGVHDFIRTHKGYGTDICTRNGIYQHIDDLGNNCGINNKYVLKSIQIDLTFIPQDYFHSLNDFYTDDERKIEKLSIAFKTTPEQVELKLSLDEKRNNLDAKEPVKVIKNSVIYK